MIHVSMMYKCVVIIFSKSSSIIGMVSKSEDIALPRDLDIALPRELDEMVLPRELDDMALPRELDDMELPRELEVAELLPMPEKNAPAAAPRSLSSWCLADTDDNTIAATWSMTCLSVAILNQFNTSEIETNFII